MWLWSLNLCLSLMPKFAKKMPVYFIVIPLLLVQQLLLPSFCIAPRFGCYTICLCSCHYIGFFVSYSSFLHKQDVRILAFWTSGLPKKSLLISLLLSATRKFTDLIKGPLTNVLLACGPRAHQSASQCWFFSIWCAVRRVVVLSWFLQCVICRLRSLGQPTATTVYVFNWNWIGSWM